MRRFFVFFVLFFSTFTTVLKAQPSSEIDRRELFTKVYENLPKILGQVMEQIGNLPQVEKTYMIYIFMAVTSYTSADLTPTRPKIPLQFSRDKKLFSIDPNLPPRTAVVGVNPGDPIIVNLNIINQRGFQIRILDIVQLFLHELGHFVPIDQDFPERRQALINSVGSKVRGFLQPMVKEKRSLDGAFLQIFSGTSVLLDKSQTQRVRALDPFLDINPFFAFAEGKGRTSVNLTQELVAQMETRRKLEVTEAGQAQLWRFYFWNILSLEETTENDPKRSWFRMRASHAEFVKPNHFRLEQGGTNNSIDVGPDTSAEMHDFVVGVDLERSTIDRIYNTSGFSRVEIDDSASLTKISEDDRRIVVQLTYDADKYERGIDGAKANLKINVRVMGHLYSVPGKKVRNGVFEFEIIRPSTPGNLSLESFCINREVEYFLRTGISVQNSVASVLPKQMRIKKLGLVQDGQYRSLRSELEVATADGFLEVTVHSAQPIIEVELLQSKSYRILNETANQDFFKAYVDQLNGLNVNTPAIRVNYDLLTLDPTQFQQEQIAEGLIKIRIPIDFTLGPLLRPRKSSPLDELKRNGLGSAIMNIESYLKNYLAAAVDGTDLGLFALHQIRVLNQDLQVLRVTKKKPFIFTAHPSKKPFYEKDRVPKALMCRSLLERGF